jgi:hypothetical protein
VRTVHVEKIQQQLAGPHVWWWERWYTVAYSSLLLGCLEAAVSLKSVLTTLKDFQLKPFPPAQALPQL